MVEAANGAQKALIVDIERNFDSLADFYEPGNTDLIAATPEALLHCQKERLEHRSLADFEAYDEIASASEVLYERLAAFCDDMDNMADIQTGGWWNAHHYVFHKLLGTLLIRAKVFDCLKVSYPDVAVVTDRRMGGEDWWLRPLEACLWQFMPVPLTALAERVHAPVTSSGRRLPHFRGRRFIRPTRTWVASGYGVEAKYPKAYDPKIIIAIAERLARRQAGSTSDIDASVITEKLSDLLGANVSRSVKVDELAAAVTSVFVSDLPRWLKMKVWFARLVSLIRPKTLITGQVGSLSIRAMAETVRERGTQLWVYQHGGMALWRVPVQYWAEIRPADRFLCWTDEIKAAFMRQYSLPDDKLGVSGNFLTATRLTRPPGPRPKTIMVASGIFGDNERYYTSEDLSDCAKFQLHKLIILSLLKTGHQIIYKTFVGQAQEAIVDWLGSLADDRIKVIQEGYLYNYFDMAGAVVFDCFSTGILEANAFGLPVAVFLPRRNPDRVNDSRLADEVLWCRSPDQSDIDKTTMQLVELMDKPFTPVKVLSDYWGGLQT